jgi:hypothetical protein
MLYLLIFDAFVLAITACVFWRMWSVPRYRVLGVTWSLVMLLLVVGLSIAFWNIE